MANSQNNNALWILDFAFKHAPEVFHVDARLQRYWTELHAVNFERDVLGMKCKPTPWEVENGLKTDEGWVRYLAALKNGSAILKSSMTNDRVE